MLEEREAVVRIIIASLLSLTVWDSSDEFGRKTSNGNGDFKPGCD